MDGLLLIDKPAGLTSHDVVGFLRQRLGMKSVGHTGTLDPLATGLLVMVLGEATKLSDYLICEDKEYEVGVRLGLTTDTLDSDGQVTSRFDGAWPDLNETLEIAKSLQGDFDWPVPIFSAVKQAGKKLYEHGRAGEQVELPIKTMSYWDFHCLSQSEYEISVRISCSKGSFIRTWADQLGQRLGVGGIVQSLRRIRVGNWTIHQAKRLDEIQSPNDMGCAFIPMSQSLPGFKTILASPKEARLVGHGQIPRDILSRLVFEQKQAFESGRPVVVKVVSAMGDLLALLAAEPGQGLKIKRVFRTLS